MIKIGQEIHWTDQLFTCVDSKVVNAGKKASVRYEWRSACACGEEYSFTCFAWQFPFCSPSRITKSGIVKPQCRRCEFARKKTPKIKLSARLAESLRYAIAEVLPGIEPATSVQIQAEVCKLSDKVYMTCFHAHERDLAKQAFAAIKNAHLKGYNGIISETLSSGRKLGIYKYKNNRWYRSTTEDFIVARRNTDVLDQAVNVVRFVLAMSDGPTAPEIREQIMRMDVLADEVKKRFAFGGSSRAQSAALNRLLCYMRDELKLTVNNGEGRGARWTLAE